MSVRKRSASISELLIGDAAAVKKRHLPNTGEWLIHDPVFRKWAADENKYPFLWLNGPSGFGKTFLVHTIVQYLQASRGILPLRYFCDAYSTPASMIRSLLNQMVASPECSPKTRSSILRISGNQESTPGDVNGYALWDQLSNIVKAIDKTTIIIDGLDEVHQTYKHVLEFNLPRRLRDLAERNHNNVRVLVSSCAEPEMQSTFQGLPKLELTPALVRGDLEKHITSQLEEHPTLQSYSAMITSKVLDTSNGSFIAASLALKQLASITSDAEIPEELERISQNIKDLYSSVLQNSAQSLTPLDLRLRELTLRLIALAPRFLHSQELRTAIEIELNATIGDVESRVVKACGSLVKFEHHTLKPLHATLGDFLATDQKFSAAIGDFDQKRANTQIAKMCIKYLTQSAIRNFRATSCDPDTLGKDYSFLEYATLYWAHHASLSDCSNLELKELVKAFFRSPNAFVWADKFLPAFISRSVVPLPPRPPHNARFFHLFTLKSQVANLFAGDEKCRFNDDAASLLIKSYEEALEEVRSNSSSKMLAILERLMDLSEVYGWLDHREKATTLMEEAMALSSKATETESSTLSIDIHQALANTYKVDGKYSNAKRIFEKLLYLAEDRLPANDSRLMFALDGLGWVKMRLGDLEGAAKDLQAASEISTEAYGSFSPMTLRSKVTLAEVLTKLGRIKEAETLCAELKEQLRVHRQTGLALPRDSISHLNTLALVYTAEGKLEEARDTWTVVVEQRRKTFGEEHRITLWASLQLALLLETMGEKERAGDMFSDLLPKQEKVLGTSHPDVRETKDHLQLLRISFK